MTTSPAPSRLTARHWRTRRSAAVAGILFAVLLITAMVMMRLALRRRLARSRCRPTRPAAGWCGGACTSCPFAGIAFLWFIGVVRDQLGDVEDRLFSTVFLGSGLLFLAMLFAGAAATTSVLELVGPALARRRGVGLRPGQHPDAGVGLRDADGGRVHAVGEHRRPADRRAAALGRPTSATPCALVLLVAAGEHKWSQLRLPGLGAAA